jgi:hypothetical protein
MLHHRKSKKAECGPCLIFLGYPWHSTHRYRRQSPCSIASHRLALQRSRYIASHRLASHDIALHRIKSHRGLSAHRITASPALDIPSHKHMVYRTLQGIMSHCISSHYISSRMKRYLPVASNCIAPYRIAYHMAGQPHIASQGFMCEGELTSHRLGCVNTAHRIAFRVACVTHRVVLSGIRQCMAFVPHRQWQCLRLKILELHYAWLWDTQHVTKDNPCARICKLVSVVIGKSS